MNSLLSHPWLSRTYSIAGAVLLLTAISASHIKAETPQEHPSVIGAWIDTFEDNALAVFLPDGRVLFTFLTKPQREDWHLLGKWKEIKPGNIEVTTHRGPPFDDQGGEQKDVYGIDPQFPDFLISPHGGGMKRVVAPAKALIKSK